MASEDPSARLIRHPAVGSWYPRRELEGANLAPRFESGSRLSFYVICAVAGANGFLDAVEGMVFLDQRVDAESLDRLLGALRLQPRDGKADALVAAGLDGIAHDLRRGEVDLDDPGGLQHDQARRLRRVLDQTGDVAAEVIGIEKRQRRLE